MEKERSAGIVLVNDEKYLLLRYTAGHWDLVKGHVEIGESDKEAAIRECEEETGIIELEFLDFSGDVHYFFRRGEELVSKDVIYFYAKTNTKEIKLSHEHQDFIWLDIDEAIKKITFKSSKEILKKIKLKFQVH